MERLVGKTGWIVLFIMVVRMHQNAIDGYS
jgi:hypothetical protein